MNIYYEKFSDLSITLYLCFQHNNTNIPFDICYKIIEYSILSHTFPSPKYKINDIVKYKKFNKQITIYYIYIVNNQIYYKCKDENNKFKYILLEDQIHS